MPEMMVWPVSSSVRTWKVGSSSDSAKRALPILSWSTLVFGSTATWITGSGNSRFSSTISRPMSQSVSPVRVFLKPMPATMSPAKTASMSSRSLACIWRMRPMRSLVPVRRVEDLAALLERAGVDPEVGELADVGVGHDLEGEGRERLVVGGLALELLVALEVHALGGRQVERARQVVDDGVEQGLHALVLERRAVEDRDDLAGDGAVADGAAEVVDGDLLLADELLEDVLVERAEHVDELGAVLLGLVLEVGGDLHDVPLGAELLVVPDEGLHRDEVDDALVVALGADRQLDDGRRWRRGAP